MFKQTNKQTLLNVFINHEESFSINNLWGENDKLSILSPDSIKLKLIYVFF